MQLIIFNLSKNKSDVVNILTRGEKNSDGES